MPQTTKTRMTRQRMVIMEELRKVDTHPTAEELYTLVRRRLPHISLGTVYRNLDLLSASNKISKIESAGSMRRFDGNTMPHRHIRCVNCGRVADIHGDLSEPESGDIKVPGFQITAVRVEYDGVCDVCSRQRQ